MQSIFNTIQTLLICGTLLSLALAVLLSMPKSKLRAFVLPIVGWGLVDDIGAAVTGIVAARTAMNADKC